MDSFARLPNGNSYEILQDEWPDNPREWDNLGTFLLFHKKYKLGDPNPYKESDFRSWDSLKVQIVKDIKPVVMIDISMVDHSSLFLYEGSGPHAHDPGGWDSGQIGFAFVRREAATKEFGKITRAVKYKCLEILRGELTTYKQYLEGDVWACVVKGPDGEVLESIGGFYGRSECVVEAERIAAIDSPKLSALKELASCVC